MDEDTSGGATYQGDVLLLAEEAMGLVTQAAAASGTILRMSSQAKRLSQSPLALGFSTQVIADQLLLAAAHAGVPIEIDKLG